MKTVTANPPNIDLIKIALPITKENIYCYGDTVYNPSGNEIEKDIYYHEAIHSIQQDKKPEAWWNRYLTDKHFRLDQELEAYAHQYNFIKKHYPPKAHKPALDNLADNLSRMYNVQINFAQAGSRIRNRAKMYEQKTA